MEQRDQESTAASFDQRIEASKAETEQKLQNFFSELPKMRMDSIFQNLDSFNQSFRMEDPKTREERMTRLAEGLIIYKSGDEWADGEEWKFTLIEERGFRRHLAELSYVPWDFAKIPLKEVARRTIKEVMEVGRAFGKAGKAYVSAMSKAFKGEQPPKNPQNPTGQ